ncbi:DnaJ like chaperone protein [Sinobacterium caligoides]|uniref:Co-chaperone protein DjlA n=1 Tax=Sinobacterium caligoides TaxID=933926 RepID=A0A3N2DZS6_9GAMM|nr:co-chaperone DjlA [Sinobacterium caligoides]ROS04939.1 DnaJ like chaperone protein [Sinobacterium caligoides]
MFGRLIGLVLGFSVFGFIGAFIGYFIGRYFDRSIAGLGNAGMGPEQQARAQQVFFESVFKLMGVLAKADGRVSEAEVSQTEQVMSQMGLSAENRQQAITLFKQGVAGQHSVADVMMEFNSACGPYANLKRMLLAYLIGVALADGHLDDVEQQILSEISRGLGISDFAFRQLLAMIRAQANFSQQHGGQYSGGFSQAPSVDELALAYTALGVASTDDDKSIKKAYRKLMSENHPDKLRGQGVPDDMLRMATERSQEITTAYELIKKHRAATA